VNSSLLPNGNRLFRVGLSACFFLGNIALFAPTIPVAAAISAPANFFQPLACDASNPVTLEDRALADTTPCTLAKHHSMLEVGYFQNASAVGGTALAAYPLIHVRYGITDRTQIFIDPATAIAKSGLRGQGIYTWGRTGVGVKYQLSNEVNHAVSASIDYTPQPDVTASLYTRERFQAAMQYRYVITNKTSANLSFGDTFFSQQNVHGNGQSSLFARLAVSQGISPNMSVSALVGRDAHMTVSSEPQTQLGVTVQDRLSPNSVGDVELGSALNPSGETKAHYLGFGYALLH
jgi:hypothetical protein